MAKLISSELLKPANLKAPQLMHRTSAFIVPAPESRVPVAMYAEVRAWLLENDPDAQEMLGWSNNDLQPPETPERMASEIIWIILCAGRSAQAARTIEKKVWGAIEEGRPVVQAFGYRAKAEAIERAWRERKTDFERLQQVLANGSVEALVQWCGALPFIGDDTQFQLAKNFGADLAKPDIWLCRLTGIPDKPRRAVRFRFPACMALARGLAQSSGDRIATVDSLLWLACNKGVLSVGADAGPVSFTPKQLTARSIYEAGAVDDSQQSQPPLTVIESPLPPLNPLHYNEERVMIGHQVVPMDQPLDGVFWCDVCGGHPDDPIHTPGYTP